MLKIRLQRVGKRHDPSFRVVLVDSRRGPQSGNFLEILGNYNAQKGTPTFEGERIKELMSSGAQVSDTVFNLLVSEKIIKGEKQDVLKHNRIRAKLAKKKPIEVEVKKEKIESVENVTGGGQTPEVPKEVAQPIEEKVVETPKVEVPKEDEKKEEPVEEKV